MASGDGAIVDSNGGCSWESLPIDVLGCIVERLDAIDVIRFSSVCITWARAAPPQNKGHHRPLARPMPYLLLPGEGGEQSDYCTLQTFPEGRSYRLGPLPELQGKWFIGCQDGWLVILDEFSSPSILNPLTKSHIQLPSITTFPNVEPLFRSAFGIKKIIFSTNPSSVGSVGYAALAIFDVGYSVFIFKSGEEKWAIVEELSDVSDAIYDHRDRRFLAVCYHGQVHAIDPSSPTTKASLVVSGYGCFASRYLVFDLSGDLIQVCRSYNVINIEKHGEVVKTYAIDVQRLDPRTKTWAGIKSLGDNSLFLGNCHSIALSGRNISGLEANCIYFTDDDWGMVGHDWSKGKIPDIGVYKLEDATFVPWYPADSRIPWSWTAWITPTLH